VGLAVTSDQFGAVFASRARMVPSVSRTERLANWRKLFPSSEYQTVPRVGSAERRKFKNTSFENSVCCRRWAGTRPTRPASSELSMLSTEKIPSPEMGSTARLVQR